MSRPYTISPDDIRAQEFRSRMRGYDPEQVRSYLEDVADQVQQLQMRVSDLRSRLADAERDVDESRLRDNDTTSPGLPAAQFTEEYRQAAETDAKGILEKAGAEAKALMASAQAQVDDLNRQIDELKTLREKIISQSETLLQSQLEHLRVLRIEVIDADNGDAPEARPILADLDENTRPGQPPA